LIAAYLDWSGLSVDQTYVERIIVDYVDEAVFSDDNDANKISCAIRCQDILGPLVPGTQARFRSIRRFLDASHFVSTVLFEGKNVKQVSPLELREMSGLDALETVLQTVPESVVSGSAQWKDSVFAAEANHVYRQVWHSMEGTRDDVDKEVLPTLPGGAIFRLATILALKGSNSVIAVKCRVIHYAMECHFHGAAAAIARTLLHLEDSGESSSDAMDLAKLGAIAEVVSDDTYQDIMTKKELCDWALSQFGTSLSATHSDPFNIVLQSSSNLDVVTSRFNQEFNQLARGRKENLLFRPLARLYKHIFFEYNSDVHQLFVGLLKQADEQVVHDSLINALSRFVFYWCIHETKTLKNIIDLWDLADFHDNLAFGCSLLLTPSKLTAQVTCSWSLPRRWKLHVR
jgi:hypothetical protein